MHFEKLSTEEQAAVKEYAWLRWKEIAAVSPDFCVSTGQDSDSEPWEERLCELIAGDPKRVQAIVEAAGSKANLSSGFTLIELSIVLVIIGLIVGGVLVGQNLIAAAGVRATIAQIEKYQTAVNTFRGKYNALPGDIADPGASQFGFAARGSSWGQGDGDGIITGNAADWCESGGETTAFWVDLSTAHLIDGSFIIGTPTSNSGLITPSSSPNFDAYFPQAKLGKGNYIYVWSGGPATTWNDSGNDSTNYFSISAITSINGPSRGETYSNPGLTANEAYSIDKKIDDGLPQSGNVTAIHLSAVWWYANWAAGGGNLGASAGSNGPTTVATPGSVTTCYDNGGVGGTTQQYSLAQKTNNLNCALSFQFQ